MRESLVLLPPPQVLVATEQQLTLAPGWIELECDQPSLLLPVIERLQATLHAAAGVDWALVAGGLEPQPHGLRITVRPGTLANQQGYRLEIDAAAIRLLAATPAGAFYGCQTLMQLIEQCGATLPGLEIEDWPAFPDRGVMLDVSRDKVPTLATLELIIDELARWKFNQVQLYTEHTFAYRQHPEVWADASPLTGADVLALDAFCRARFIELVPNQNTFGHLRRWLIHPRYRQLAECPDGCDTGDPVWGVFEEPFSLAPTNPASLQLVQSMFDELLPHFTARRVNVGCDETIELGLGYSRAAVAERGRGRVYLDFLLAIYRDLKRRGRSMQFWGDIIMEHPELVGDLPRDVLALEWGYEAEHPFAQHGAAFAAAGVPFYVCPGTSSWNSVAGRTHNALANLANAAANGLRHGARGVLITDWGDNGHWQPWPVSYLGLAWGAVWAWRGAADGLDVRDLLNTVVLRDSTSVLGAALYDLGAVDQIFGAPQHNATWLFRTLQSAPALVRSFPALSLERLRAADDYLQAVLERLPHARPQRADAALISAELTWAGRMLQHACRRGTWILSDDAALLPALRSEITELIAEHERIWLARNRPGGLRDSAARLHTLLHDYEV